MSACTKHEIASRSLTKCLLTKCVVQRFVGECDINIVTLLFKISFLDFLSYSRKYIVLCVCVCVGVCVYVWVL